MALDQEQFSNQTLTEHLTDLRKRIVNSLLGLAIVTCVTYAYSDKIFDIVRQPIAPFLPTGGLFFAAPADKFMVHLKLSLVCGLIFSCPIWLSQIWMFIAPGLYKNERKFAAGFVISGTLLFLMGVAFAYFGVLPAAFEFLLSYGGDQDKPMIMMDQYLSFFTQMCLIFGVAFELPLVMVVLGLRGKVSQKILRINRRYAVVVLSILAAIATPPDVYSMMMMLVPLVALFEVSIILVGFFERKRLASEL
ncbi:MAG: twin-arginine translocase subunit TatC [Pseudobdellovibrionaceae bacterium]